MISFKMSMYLLTLRLAIIDKHAKTHFGKAHDNKICSFMRQEVTSF